jgi:hypothetical protein
MSPKVVAGFFSFTEITDPNEHHSYNEWHMLDHMPEQYPLPGIVYGQRWVSTPACRADRAVSGAMLDPIHYVTLYLMQDPLDETLRDFYRLGRELHDANRFHLHRQARLSGAFPLEHACASQRVLISAAAVPYRPNRGVYVVVQALDAAAIDLDAWCASPGVAGVWSFADGERRVTVAWLDDDPRSVAPALALPDLAGVEFAGPFETITPWKWTWFDHAS